MANKGNSSGKPAKAKTKTNYQPVHIDNATYALIKNYSSAFGMPITKVVAEMANDWLTTVGKERLKHKADYLESLSMIVQQAKVLTFGSNPSVATDAERSTGAAAGKA